MRFTGSIRTDVSDRHPGCHPGLAAAGSVCRRPWNDGGTFQSRTDRAFEAEEWAHATRAGAVLRWHFQLLAPASHMISALPTPGPGKVTPIRDTSATDRPVDPAPELRMRRYRWAAIGVGVAILVAIAIWLIRGWLDAEASIPLERVRTAEVTRGMFIRDVAAQGTVVAAVSPTIVLACCRYCALRRASRRQSREKPSHCTSSTVRSCVTNWLGSKRHLRGMEVSVQRQSIETRRQLLANQQTIDLAEREHSRRRSASSGVRRIPGASV